MSAPRESLARIANPGRGHGEEESAAFCGFAIGPDAAAVRFHDAPRDVEAQSETTPVVAADLPEPSEDCFQVLGRDSRPGVRDRDARLASTALRPDGDSRSRGGEFDRVSDQI